MKLFDNSLDGHIAREITKTERALFEAEDALSTAQYRRDALAGRLDRLRAQQDARTGANQESTYRPMVTA